MTRPVRFAITAAVAVVIGLATAAVGAQVVAGLGTGVSA